MAESKRLTLPPTPDAYKHELPKDFKAPEGFGDFKFNAEDPALKNFAAVAHEAGLSQDQYAKALGSYAATQIAAQQAVKQAREAEVTKLGVNGPARVDAIMNWAKGTFGDTHGKTIADSLWTAAQVEAWEAVMQKVTSGGSSSFSQQHRDVSGPVRKLSNDEYARLTTAEKKAYAAQFPQDQYSTRAA